jgi:hypothetical protein
LHRRGIDVRLSASGYLIAPIAVPTPEKRAMLKDLEPLLVPYLRDGKPPPCGVTKHEPPVEAATVEYLGLEAFCGRCETKRSKP